jgi:hypothetical protein
MYPGKYKENFHGFIAGGFFAAHLSLSLSHNDNLCSSAFIRGLKKQKQAVYLFPLRKL